MESQRDDSITDELSVFKEGAATIALDQMPVEEIRFDGGKLSRHGKDA
jgi:hypothetical protein